MRYDFDTILNRFNTGSGKWEEMLKYGITPEMQVVPMSNAEMEFVNAPEIIEGLQEYLNTAVLAYFRPMQGYYDALINWMQKRFNWTIKKEWIRPFPGIHGALSTILSAYAKPGDGVIVMTPTWPGFFHVLGPHECKKVDVPLIPKGNTYYIDFETLEKKAADPNNKIMFFCSPHNPVGRVWTREELERVADICVRNDVLLVSDEVHADLIMPGYAHIPIASLSPEISQRTITCTAPSKTFNLAGMSASNLIIENEELRVTFMKTMSKNGVSNPNMLALKACELAYSKGEDWLEACIAKLNENRLLVEKFISEKLPMLSVAKMEGTYLMWLDMRNLGLTTEELERALMEDAHVFFDDGYYFGENGAGFERVNISCPTEAVRVALERLYNWIQTLPAFKK